MRLGETWVEVGSEFRKQTTSSHWRGDLIGRKFFESANHIFTHGYPTNRMRVFEFQMSMHDVKKKKFHRWFRISNFKKFSPSTFHFSFYIRANYKVTQIWKKGCIFKFECIPMWFIAAAVRNTVVWTAIYTSRHCNIGIWDGQNQNLQAILP